MSLDVGSQTQRAVEAEAAAAGVSVDVYLLRLQLEDSMRSHVSAHQADPDEARLAALEAEQAQAEIA